MNNISIVFFQNKIKLVLLLIIFVKLIFLVTFTSEYSSDLFQPFVKNFIENGINPWQYYLDHNLNLDAFPYHPLMLYILSIFSYSIELFKIENFYLVNFFFKLPLFLSDIVIFYILLKLFKDQYIKIILFYFINPIILYSTYIHAQLDIIPTALIMIALYLLLQKHLKASAVILGLALATKAHVLLTLPLFLIFVYKRYSIVQSSIYLAISLATLLFFDFPYLHTDGFREMVLINQKQSLLFDSYYNIGELKIFLPLFSVIAILSHFFNQRKVNIDLLFFYFGILFTAIIFFVLPAPAWYVWIAPFISIYFIKSNNINQSLLLYAGLSIFYLTFFIFFYPSQYTDIVMMNTPLDFKVHNNQLINVSFTLLEAMVATILFVFYKYGVKSNSIYKKISNTIIGIGGDSGVGKTSLLKDLKLLLGNRLLELEGDGEHKWERGHSNWDNYTHLDPKANYIHHQANAIYALKHHSTIKRSDYDHNTGTFTKAITIKPKEFILLSGLHPFYLPTMRKNIDLKIYIDTDEQLRRHWKILRDTKNRGYSIDKIMRQIEKRVADTKKYIYPQKNYSDIIIRYYPIEYFKLGDSSAHYSMGVKLIFDANIHIEQLVEELDCNFTWDYNDDLSTQYLDLTEEPNNNFSQFSAQYIPNIFEIIDTDHQWLNGYRGIIQLIILISLSEKMKGERNEV